MKDIDEMVRMVTSKLFYRGIKVHNVEWINEHHNCILFSDKGTYVLKYSKQWMMAGASTKELGPGAGMTFNLVTYLKLSLQKELPTMMFGFPESDHVYYLPWDEFNRLSAKTTQPNGEDVRVILTKSLKRF